MAAPVRRAPVPRGKEAPGWILLVLNTLEDVVYLVVALSLIGIAAAALYNTIHEMLNSSLPFAEVVTTAVSGVLFVVIVLEIFRTVVAHLEGGGFQLMPFLIIGVISAVRHILLVGALSFSSSTSNDAFTHAQIELGVNAGVALVLVIALVLVHRSGMTSDLESGD
jgi:uncharacterized membrane protein (DUF373 family)